MAEQFFGATDVGRQRNNNEDAFLVRSLGRTGVAACVIDGVGGYEGGEVAAGIAKEKMEQALQRPGPDAVSLMRQTFLSANEAIFRAKEEGQHPSMACVLTMAIADLAQNQFWYAHVGDTRLYLLRDDSLVKITKDQSFVGMLEDSGRLNEAEAMRHPKRNEIDKALGFGALAPEDIETGTSPFLPGDLLLLCTDGLTDLVPVAGMKQILLQDISLEEKASQLIAAANAAGGKDNITVALVQNTKKPIKQKAKMPAPVKRPAEPLAEESSEVLPQPAKPSIEKPKPLPKNNRNQAAVISLSVLCAVLLGGLVYLIWRQYQGSELAHHAPPPKGAAERRLQEAINTSASDTLVLDPAVFGPAISLTDTVFINRDSLYLTGRVLLQRDSLYQAGGPAVVVGPQCKWVVLDGLQWQNFSIAVVAANPDVVQLKANTFINCGITLAYAGNGQDFFHGMWVNTRKATDSLPPKSKPTRR